MKKKPSSEKYSSVEHGDEVDLKNPVDLERRYNLQGFIVCGLSAEFSLFIFLVMDYLVFDNETIFQI